MESVAGALVALAASEPVPMVLGVRLSVEDREGDALGLV